MTDYLYVYFYQQDLFLALLIIIAMCEIHRLIVYYFNKIIGGNE